MCCAGDKALRNFCPHIPPAACPAPPPPPPPADATLAANSDSTVATADTGITGSGKAERSAMRAVINAGGGVEGGNSEPASRHLSTVNNRGSNGKNGSNVSTIAIAILSTVAIAILSTVATATRSRGVE